VRGAQADRLAAQAARTQAHERQRGPHAELDADRVQGRRARLGQEIAEARAAGDIPRVARLRARDRRLAEEAAGHAGAIAAWHGPSPVIASSGEPKTMAHDHAWLDNQAALRRGVPPGPRADPSTYRDYPRLAALAGVSPHEYRTLEPGPQRRVRLEVDRALRARARATDDLAGGRDEERRPTDRATPRRPAPEAIRRPHRTDRERQFGRDSDERPSRPARRRDDGPQ
jgi:hypothetical protein